MPPEIEPGLQRRVLKYANRKGLTASDIQDVLDYATYLNGQTPLQDTDHSAEALVAVWIESFNEPQTEA